jgi:hypothetical protein
MIRVGRATPAASNFKRTLEHFERGHVIGHDNLA